MVGASHDATPTASASATSARCLTTIAHSDEAAGHPARRIDRIGDRRAAESRRLDGERRRQRTRADEPVQQPDLRRRLELAVVSVSEGDDIIGPPDHGAPASDTNAEPAAEAPLERRREV